MGSPRGEFETDMIDLDIPGFGSFTLKHLVLDYNGTLALDGRLLPGVHELLGMLSKSLEIHVVTSDTFCLAEAELGGLPVKLTIVPEADPAVAKFEYVRWLGPETVVAIGNGSNDRKMLAAAAIGIFTVQREGGSVRAMGRADIITNHVLEALELIRNPKRLVATLRS